jgi:hypothetical protein
MLLGQMHKEVFCLDMSSRLFPLPAVNQFRAPGTNRIKACAKLGATLGVHARNAVDKGTHSAGRSIQRAKDQA